MLVTEMAGLSETFPTLDCSQCILTPRMVDVGQHPKIKLHTYSEVEAVEGFVGNFETTIAPNSSNGKHGPAREPVKVKHGAAVLAVGGGESRPSEYLYGEDSRVLTQEELEDIIKENEGKEKSPFSDMKSVVMIQCVGSRDEEHP